MICALNRRKQVLVKRIPFLQFSDDGVKRKDYNSQYKVRGLFTFIEYFTHSLCILSLLTEPKLRLRVDEVAMVALVLKVSN